MTEIEKLFIMLSDGLKSMAKGVEKLADKVENIGKTMSEEEPKTPKASKQKSKPKGKPSIKKAAKPAEKKGKKPTAADAVIGVIEGSEGGAGYPEIMAKTGFDRKKVANILSRLNKLGKIKSVKRGVYTTV